jgi:hypothetical protein
MALQVRLEGGRVLDPGRIGEQMGKTGRKCDRFTAEACRKRGAGPGVSMTYARE